ncbi:GTPase ObgE [Chloroflexota bacterium]
MFDKVEITVRGSNGGDGVVSFRHEKYVPFGGPDGGDGGDGGNVIVMADSAVTDLRIFRTKGFYQAGKGMAGMGGKRHGKKGRDLILSVPVGTVVLNRVQIGENAFIASLEYHGQQVVVAKGGQGGLGNVHFASSTNQAPRIAQKGDVGEENSIILELRLIADVGIIGYPNAGKSTLLASASVAKPKIASYPFTTREPVLGVVEVGQQSFVLAEIPGLIDGAHFGRGLGHDFLRHIVRTKILIHLVDGSSTTPVEDMLRVNTELSLFDSALVKKPQLLAVNKVDLPQVQARLSEIEGAFNSAGTKCSFISAATGESVAKFMAETMAMLQSTTKVGIGEKAPVKIFRPQPRGSVPSVHKEGDIFIVVAPELERIVARIDMTGPQIPSQFQRQLIRLGVSKALEKAGIKPGDRVHCGDYEWEW